MSNIKTPEDQKTKDEPGASVDEQIDDSFPASDPPSYNAGGRVGQPHRDKAEADKADADKADADKAKDKAPAKSGSP